MKVSETVKIKIKDERKRQKEMINRKENYLKKLKRQKSRQ
jgi:hypothetical protein